MIKRLEERKVEKYQQVDDEKNIKGKYKKGFFAIRKIDGLPVIVNVQKAIK